MLLSGMMVSNFKVLVMFYEKMGGGSSYSAIRLLCDKVYNRRITGRFRLQVKVLVPNTTAGMIIGKGGNYIRQIKEHTGAYVQISQKSKDLNLPERCITIAGERMLVKWSLRPPI